MQVTPHDNAIGRRGVLHEARERNRRLAILLVSFARPHHRKANEPLRKDAVIARGPRARGGEATATAAEMDGAAGAGAHTSRLHMNNRFVSA